MAEYKVTPKMRLFSPSFVTEKNVGVPTMKVKLEACQNHSNGDPFELDVTMRMEVFAELKFNR